MSDSWDNYKALCERPDYFSRWALVRTIECRHEPELEAMLSAILEDEPLPKPGDHTGGPETDFFRVELTPERVTEVIGRLEAVSHREAESGRRQLAHLTIVWGEYLEMIRAGR